MKQAGDDVSNIKGAIHRIAPLIALQYIVLLIHLLRGDAVEDK